MSLELRKSSKWWYGVFMENRVKTIVNLKVPIAGAHLTVFGIGRTHGGHAGVTDRDNGGVWQLAEGGKDTRG